ncbi:hypothetical protein A7A08_01476 [Methyloligella halotolerans]|uniref:MetA-pathway of phenol degradation n=1 Tax=Methyloligella halotolerans TaxID=1177755 RepID=A0A1E2RZ04_9HYPH|nr:hypothetical protein [Methyloligella halotolerans]ODA67444.1 hypothetical protein A7A08_01476 [Methyloligella halotolerans]
MVAIATAAAVGFGSPAARAEFEIPQVNAEAGSIEAEYRGATHDGILLAEPDEEANLEQSHELEFQLAPTDSWMFRITPGLTQPQGGDLTYNYLNAETQFVLLRRPPEGLGIAFMLGYTHPFNEAQGEPDEYEYGPIIEYATGSWLLTLNPLLTGERGPDAVPGAGFEYAAQLQYQFARHWAIAAQAFGEIESLSNSGPFENQVHRAGPTLYLLLGEEEFDEFTEQKEGSQLESSWKIGLGALFALTPATTDLSLKAMVALEY